MAGEGDVTVLAECASGRKRSKIPELQWALEGTVGPHQRILLARQLAHIDYLDEAIAGLCAELARRLAPLEAAIVRLNAVAGIGRATAEVILAEIGTDIGRFPSVGHLASWCGLVPGCNESAGTRKTTRTRKGSPWLRVALVEAAKGASRTKDSYLSAQYRRIAAHRGTKGAVVAVAHSIIEIVYHLLSTGQLYQDLGVTYFDERDRRAIQRRLVQRLERLGFDVSLTTEEEVA